MRKNTTSGTVEGVVLDHDSDNTSSMLFHQTTNKKDATDFMMI